MKNRGRARTPRIFYSPLEICLLCNQVGWCLLYRYPRKLPPQALPPPPNLWELEAARKPRSGGSIARPGQVAAASCLCSTSKRPSHASCREKHTPCLTLGRNSPSAQRSTSVPCALRHTEMGRMHTLSPGSSQPGTN